MGNMFIESSTVLFTVENADTVSAVQGTKYSGKGGEPNISN